MVMSSRALSWLTITAMPSMAIWVGVSSASSLSFSSREAMPMSQVPSMAAVMPAEESVCWISMVALGFSSR